MKAPRCLLQNNNSKVPNHDNEELNWLVVGHVTRRWTEFRIRLDDLVNGVDEISLCGNLASWADCKHSRLSTDAMYVST